MRQAYRLRHLVPRRCSTPFPYTTLFRSQDWSVAWRSHHRTMRVGPRSWVHPPWEEPPPSGGAVAIDPGMALGTGSHPDRKSTRLNSSHLGISYAVLCLKNTTADLHRRPS